MFVLFCGLKEMKKNRKIKNPKNKITKKMVYMIVVCAPLWRLVLGQFLIEFFVFCFSFCKIVLFLLVYFILFS